MKEKNKQQNNKTKIKSQSKKKTTNKTKKGKKQKLAKTSNKMSLDMTSRESYHEIVLLHSLNQEDW